MIKVGINGFGRIGKCCFLQLIESNKFQICALNSTQIKITEIEDYLKYDSTHFNYNKQFEIEILSDTKFRINHHIISFLSDRNLKNLEWSKYGCEYIIDCTGSFLTTKKCLDYNADYVIMSAPCKDNTKTFIYGVNDNLYQGEKIVSASSCTTNCLAPMLKILDDSYGIKNCVFTTIHATTASQFTVDIANTSLRTNRSIFNNIIPHTTGASSSVIQVLPGLKGKLHGTSVRVPVLNCSLLDVNIELNDTSISMNDIKKLLMSHPLYKVVYDVSEKRLVSCDFITTTTPTILDMNASIDMGNGKMKLMLWYDNEWSYSSQLIRLVERMHTYNTHSLNAHTLKSKYYIENINLENKGVVCRLDLNLPTNNGVITDEYRLIAALDTIKYIQSQNPSYIVLTSHFGRPNGTGYQEKYSMEFLVPILEKHLGRFVKFLDAGISEATLSQLHKHPSIQNINKPTGIYLLENLRFYKEETEYEKMTDEEIQNNKIVQMYRKLGDIFICDAFGCLHRKHMSICAMSNFDKPYGYGLLIQKETHAIDMLLKQTDKKILAIIGGNKIKDKLPIIESFKVLQGTQVFVAGGLARQYNMRNGNEPGNEPGNESGNENNLDHNVIVMEDGFGNSNLELESLYIPNVKDTAHNVYDIGTSSLNKLLELVDNSDIIFWNGSLGVIEHDIYKNGSLRLIHFLNNTENKTIIIGGGETASLLDNKDNKNNKIYVSTGGGALLEFLEKKIKTNNTLVGLELFI